MGIFNRCQASRKYLLSLFWPANSEFRGLWEHLLYPVYNIYLFSCSKEVWLGLKIDSGVYTEKKCFELKSLLFSCQVCSIVELILLTDQQHIQLIWTDQQLSFIYSINILVIHVYIYIVNFVHWQLITRVPERHKHALNPKQSTLFLLRKPK